MIADIIFWASLALIGYAYIGYPILILILSLFVNTKVRASAIEPRVSLLISAYNEEKDIEAKLENSLELDYPKNKLQIVVASDGTVTKGELL